MSSFSPQRTAVVTDSTAYLPEGFGQRYGVVTVPLHVIVAGGADIGPNGADDTVDRAGGGLDGVEFGPSELAEALGARRRVTTSRPSTHEFVAAYRAALTGYEAVVSVHISAELSGTWDAARGAADEVNAEHGSHVVRVVDSRCTAMGLGFAVLAAAAVAADGGAPERVEREATEIAARTRTYFSVQTLEYLRRGGRIGAAAALVSTALAVKPLLHVRDGRIVGLEKVRTTQKALARLVELAVRACPSGEVALAVHHLDAPERAADLARRLEERLPSASGCLVSEVGAVIGAHTGPGVLGVVVLPGGLRAGSLSV